MMEFIIGTQNQINTLENLIVQALGLPKQPDVVVSRHGRDRDPAFGRTDQHAISRKHPTLDLYAIPVKIVRKLFVAYQAGVLPKTGMDRIAALTAGHKTAIRNAINNAIVLDDTWKQNDVLIP